MKYFPVFSDTAFYSLCGWIFSLCLFRYLGLPPALAVSISALLAAAIGCGVFLLLWSRSRQKLFGKKEREKRDKLLLHLALERPERIRAALLAAYLADGKDAHCQGDALRVDEAEAVPIFTMQPVSADEIALLIKRYRETPFYILCNALSDEAEKLAADFSVPVVRGDEVYTLFARTDTMPAPLICGKIPRKTAKRTLRRIFSKKNARPFFVSGSLLLLMSLFAFFPYYYIVSGSILLLGAILIRTIGFVGE